MIYYTPSSTDASTIRNRNIAIYTNTFLVNGILTSTMHQAEANKNAKNVFCDEDRKNTFLFRWCQALKSENDKLLNVFLFNRPKYPSLNRFGAHDELNFYDSVYHLNYSGAAHAEDFVHVFL